MWNAILKPHFSKTMSVDMITNMIKVDDPEKNVTDAFCIFNMVLEDTVISIDNSKNQ